MAVNGLCIVPKVNLICNEGFGNDATHTRDKGDYKGETFEMAVSDEISTGSATGYSIRQV